MYRRLISDSAVYGLGTVLIKSIGFFTLPLYTRIFSPEQFGVIEIFATLSGIFSILMNVGLDTTQSFYFMEAKNTKTLAIERVVTSITQLRLLVAVVVAGVSALLSSVIISFSFPQELPAYYVWVVLMSTVFGSLLSQCLEIFRLNYEAWKFVALSFCQTISGFSFILFFAWYLDGGIAGYLVGTAIGSFVALLFGWLSTAQYRYWLPVETALWPQFLKFGLPLLPAGLVMWIMQASDRWFVMNMLSPQEAGIYAVAAKFALIIMIAIEAFRKAWWPIAMDMLHKEDGPRFFRKISFYYVLFACVGVIALTSISEFMVQLLVAQEYKEAWRLIGLLAFGSVFYGFFLLSGLGILYSKKTYLNIWVYGFGGIVNLLLNYLLVPMLGASGAAFGTICGLFVAVVAGMLVSRKYYPVQWRWISMSLILLSAVSIVMYQSGIYEKFS